jgi:hypothetical protein
MCYAKVFERLLIFGRESSTLIASTFLVVEENGENRLVVL